MKLLLFILHLPDFLKLAYYLMGDSRVPWSLKAIVYGAIAYVISPFDILPDYLIPVLGYVEDLIIFYFSLKFLISHSPPSVVKEYVKIIDNEKRKKRWKV